MAGRGGKGVEVPRRNSNCDVCDALALLWEGGYTRFPLEANWFFPSRSLLTCPTVSATVMAYDSALPAGLQSPQPPQPHIRIVNNNHPIKNHMHRRTMDGLAPRTASCVG